MSEAPTTLTCPAGHSFPYEQLTIRNGLSVCPICEQRGWASPRTTTWSRSLLVAPFLLLVLTLVMFFVEAISGIGIGSVYQNQRIGGSGWLTAGSAVSVVGIGVIVAGVLRLIMVLRRQSWGRSLLSIPLLVMAIGAAILAIGDLVELGLNIAFVNASDPGSGWQLFGQVFDTLFFIGLAAVLAWCSALSRRPDPLPS